MENWAHKQAEESLEESEQLLRLILENAPVGILTVEPEGKIHSVNPYLCNLLGYSSEEFLSMEFEDVIFPEDQSDADPAADQLLEGKISQFDVEARLIRKDGTLITADIHVNLVRNAQGQPQLFVGQLQDITARKAAEEERHRRGELLRLTIDNAPIGMAITDLDRSIIRCNTALAGMLGYTRAELETLAVLDITHPDDSQETERYLHSMWEGSVDHHSVEKRYLRKDGSAVTCQSHISMVRDDSGEPLMIIAQIEDITERLQATRDMRRMRIHLKNMIDSMPSMLVAVDTKGLVTQWNSVAEQATGLAAQEAIGKLVGDLLPLSDSHREQIAEAISSGRPVKAERQPLTFKGQNRIVDVLVYPLLAEEVVGVVIRLDDVTDQVRMQEMMVQTEKMLSVGGLAAGMAHEINNPLGAILQSCQNIQRRLSEDLPANRATAEQLGLDLGVVHQYMETRKILQFLERIQEAGNRAAKIVRDMLTFSRRSDLHYEPIDLKDLLQTAVRLASSDFDLNTDYDIKQVEFVSDLDPKLGLVECDKTEIEQVILNLIVNAAHAMALHPEKGKSPQITLRTCRDGEYARIEVIDNGPGMDEETRRRIFEPFYTTKEVGVGTGLGLSVSYFIIYDQHKGSMQVVSKPGDGAKFIIRLPLRQG